MALTAVSGFTHLRTRPFPRPALVHEVRRCKCGTVLSRYNQGTLCAPCEDRQTAAEVEASLPLSAAVLGNVSISEYKRTHMPLEWLIEEFSTRQLMSAAGITRAKAWAAKRGERELSPEEEARLRAYTGPARLCAGTRKGYKFKPRKAKLQGVAP